MPYVPVANTVMVEIIYQWDAQTVENTLYFEMGDAPDVGQINDLLENVAGWWTNSLADQICNTIEMVEVRGTDLTTQTGPVASFVTGLPLLGGNPGEPLPANCAACVSFKTNVRGRAFRGRNYVPGLPSDEVASNHLSSGWMSATLGAYNDLPASVALSGFTHVVVSRYSGSTIVDGKKVPTPRAAGITTPVTAYSFADDVVDSQRGRLPNH